MKKLFAALVSLKLLCSCGKVNTAETETTVSETVSTTTQTEQTAETTSQVTEAKNAAKPDGIYYPPVSEREVGYVFHENATVCFAFSYLYYKSMYTSSDALSSIDKAETDAFADKLREDDKF